MELKKILWKLGFRWREFRKKKNYDIFGSNSVEYLKSSFYINLILLAFFLLSVWFLSNSVSTISQFLFWFVQTLEVTKVLKIPILDNELYYEYLTSFGLFYLLVSLIWDVTILWNKANNKMALVGESIWFWESKLFGSDLRSLPINGNWTWKQSTLRTIFGLHQLKFTFQNGTELSSPFFFPTKSNLRIALRIIRSHK